MNEYWDWSGGLGEGQNFSGPVKNLRLPPIWNFFTCYKPLLEVGLQNPALTATRVWLDRREFG